MPEFEDKTMRCPCGNSFVWYREKQVAYKRKGFNPPRYCRDCGWKRKMEKLNASIPEKKKMSDREMFGY